MNCLLFAVGSCSLRRFLPVCIMSLCRRIFPRSPLIILILHPHSTHLFTVNQPTSPRGVFRSQLPDMLICKELHFLLKLLLFPDFSAAFPGSLPLCPLSAPQKRQKISAILTGCANARNFPAGNKKEKVPSKHLFHALFFPVPKGVLCVYEKRQRTENLFEKQKYGKEFPGSRPGSVLPYFCMY